MVKRYSALAAVFALALALAASALAAPRVEVVSVKQGARLLVGGKLIALFRTPNGTLSPKGRADYAARRLTELLGDGVGAEDISVRSRGEDWGVYANGGLVMIATAEEAKERKQDPEAVARLWAANLKEALPGARAAAARPATGSSRKNQPRLPKLALSDTSVAVPVDETRRVKVGGSASGPITATATGDPCAEVQVDAGTSEIVVRGQTPGKLILRIEREGADETLTIWVKKYAGRIAETPIAEVTGVVTPASLVRQVAEVRALQGVTTEPGAIVRLTGGPTGIRALPRGEAAQVEFPVTVTGENYLPLKTTARVTVRNVALPARETKVLLYSNDPESVREYGTLYQGLVDTEGPVRLMFHHQNRMGRTITFQVHLLNPNNEPVDVQVIPAEAGPILDTIQVGHRAAQKYLSALTSDVGYMLRVPAKGVRTVYSASMGNILTISGIYGFRILNGGPLVTEVTSSAAPTTPALTADLIDTARSEPHTYPNPQKAEAHEYVCGKPWTFIPLGRKAISGTRSNRKLFGNYGVLYNLTVTVSNPTDEAKTVRVLMAAEAGWARGVFLIDGQLVEAPQTAPPGEAALWSVKLAPQEQRTIRIQSIPVGGSAYPVSLVVRS
ncbi:MAG: hypothetical protein K0Q72_895 [Armatimonadetes bacterium]|jgi:hypothetical protein|nr:hypothetical protein [Armatimonadota bacterium]